MKTESNLKHDIYNDAVDSSVEADNTGDADGNGSGPDKTVDPVSGDKDAGAYWVRKLVRELGASFVGYSDVGSKLPDSLKRYPYAVTFGIRLSSAIIEEIEDKPTFTYFNHYRSVNSLIDQIALKTAISLEDKGYMAYTIAASQSIPDAPVPFSGLFPHKTGAVLSGLVWIGKNGLFIHKDFGPRVRLGTVLTDMQLPCENKVLESKCSHCNKCVNACPAMALTGNSWTEGAARDHIVDAKACSEYMNRNFKHIGRGSVCGICIRACPFAG